MGAASCGGDRGGASPCCRSGGGGFDVRRSTEENFAEPHFEGEHADIRPLLDYSYHAMYRKDRVQVQDAIISEFCASSDERGAQMLPWVIFTAGAMGAGKGYVTSWMERVGYLPKKHFVTVDPDAIRHALPEWSAYVQHDASVAGEQTQKEAGCMAEILAYKALRQRCNVIIDGSLRDHEWYKTYFQRLRREFPGVRLMILHVQADRDEVLRRARRRGEETGRQVPERTLVASLEAVPRSVRILAPCVDFACRVHNDGAGAEPRLEREVGAVCPPADKPFTWECFHHIWSAATLDRNGDGELSAAEVSAALALGVLTKAVVASLDVDGDGAISKQEIARASEVAMANGTRRWR